MSEGKKIQEDKAKGKEHEQEYKKKKRKTSTLGERLLERLTLRYKDKLALNILKAGLHVHRIMVR